MKTHLLLPIEYADVMQLSDWVKSDPFEKFKGLPKKVNKFIVTDEFGSHPWYDSLGSHSEIKDAISKHVNVGNWSITYKSKFQRDREAGRSADYDDQMQR